MSDTNKTAITGDDIKAVKEYSDAIDKLKSSLSGVNSKLPEFSEGIEAGFKGIAEKLPEVVEAMAQLNKQNKELAASGQKPKSVLLELGSALFSWNNALSVGITLITTYGPKVLSFIGNLFESSKARAAAQALKDYNDVLLTYTQNVSKQRAEFEILLAVAKNNNVAQDTRIEAIKKLNDLSPEHLKSLTLANINTKAGTVAVDEYTKALKRKAIEDSAQLKMADLLKEKMDMAKGLNDAKKDVEKYRRGRLKDPGFGIENETITMGTGKDITREVDKAANAEKAYQVVLDQEADINKRIKDINKIVENQLKALAPRVTVPVKLSGKAYWEQVLAGQNAELKALDAGSKDFKSKSIPIIARIKATQKILSGYDVTPDIKQPYTGPKRADIIADANNELLASKDRQAQLLLSSYAKQIEDVNKHFDELQLRYKGNKKTLEQLEKERAATLAAITKNFRDQDLQKLDEYQQQLDKAAREYGKNAQEIALQQLKDEYEAKSAEINKTVQQAEADKAAVQTRIDDLNRQGRAKDAQALQTALNSEIALIDKANSIKLQIDAKYNQDKKKLDESFVKERLEKQLEEQKDKLNNKIDTSHDSGDWKTEFQQRQQLLDLERQQAVDAAGKKETALAKVKTDFDKKQQQLNKARLDAEAENQKKYLKTTEALSNATMGIFGKNTIASRIAFKAHQAAAAGQVIIDTKRSIMGIWAADGGIPFIGVPKAIAETAIVAAVGASSLASIIKQKPGFAAGGQYFSDGRGALLPGYSRTDNTNAYLRSGEAVVVSEAMRNPWARNLVSAINVAHGGRDFSIPNMGKGYAVGGIFTDGGNANRYYNQPMNDVKDLANTLAYQMINNFPPIYVDVKDVNNQQNILAQTVNRVNL